MPLETIMAKKQGFAKKFSLANFDYLPDSANVRVDVAADLLGISTVTAWRWCKNGRLPKPLKLGANTTRLNVGELRASIAKLSRKGV